MPGGRFSWSQVEVDVQLVAGERPALAIAVGDEVDHPDVHQRDLGPRGRVRAPRMPVSDEAGVVEHALVEHLALAFRRSPDDELDRPDV